MDDKFAVGIPRSPLGHLEHMDDDMELAAMDEEKTCFDPDTHPKAHHKGGLDEPVTDPSGEPIDLQTDTPNVDNLVTLDLPSVGDGDLL